MYRQSVVIYSNHQLSLLWFWKTSQISLASVTITWDQPGLGRPVKYCQPLYVLQFSWRWYLRARRKPIMPLISPLRGYPNAACQVVAVLIWQLHFLVYVVTCLHPVVGLVLQAGNAEKFPQAPFWFRLAFCLFSIVSSLLLWPLLSVNLGCKDQTNIVMDRKLLLWFWQTLQITPPTVTIAQWQSGFDRQTTHSSFIFTITVWLW